MSKRFAWLLGVVVVVSIGLLVACGSKYSASSDGLVLVTSQGSGLVQTFSFNLSTGSTSGIYNSTSSTSNQTCVLNGVPSQIVVDPTGSFAYTIINADTSNCGSGSVGGIMAFQVNSNGTMSAGSLTSSQQAKLQVCQAGQLIDETVPVVPVALGMDSAGKFLFVANGSTTDSSDNAVPGSISVFAIGSGGSLTEVVDPDPSKSSPFSLPGSCLVTPNFVALAPTPTVFPGIGLNGVQTAVCSAPGTNPPTSEFLYVVDQSNNNAVWEFGVDTSTGALGNLPGFTTVQSIPAANVPSGIAVDPCDRFVYVSNFLSNNISAYKICNGGSTQPPDCSVTSGGDGSLRNVTGSPFSVSGGANGPGPLVVDPFGNDLYVLDTLSSMVSDFHISQISGGLAIGTPATVATGALPKSLAIRRDDSWLFVANYGAASFSRFSVTPATGALTPQPTFDTDNSPWGVAVK